MTALNSSAEVAKAFNSQPMGHLVGYSREEILFKIINPPPGLILDDELKRAAAECLSEVDLNQLDQKEVGSLSGAFALAPNPMSETNYATYSRLLYLVFKIALQDENVIDEDEVPDDEEEKKHKKNKKGLQHSTAVSKQAKGNVTLTHSLTHSLTHFPFVDIDDDLNVSCVRFVICRGRERRS